VGSLAGSTLALFLTWKYDIVLVELVSALACILAFFFIKPYALGKPSS
jgi:hypothetical protein